MMRTCVLLASIIGASAACNNTLPVGQESVLTVNGRRVRVYVPTAMSDADDLPALFDFHGYGGNGAGMASLFNSIAEREGWLHIYPDGSGFIQAGWNGQGCCISGVDDVAHTKSMIAAVAEATCLDESSLFATGFSNGGFMDYKLYCEVADLFAGVAPMAGLLSGSCTPNSPLTVVHFHGTADTTIRYDGSGYGRGAVESTEFAASQMGCDLSSTTRVLSGTGTGNNGREYYCDRISGCAGGNTVELCTIVGMGHSIPRGGQNGIDAGEYLWSVFDRQLRMRD